MSLSIQDPGASLERKLNMKILDFQIEMCWYLQNRWNLSRFGNLGIEYTFSYCNTCRINIFWLMDKLMKFFCSTIIFMTLRVKLPYLPQVSSCLVVKTLLLLFASCWSIFLNRWITLFLLWSALLLLQEFLREMTAFSRKESLLVAPDRVDRIFFSAKSNF